MRTIPADILKARTKELVIDRKCQFMQHAALEILKMSKFPDHSATPKAVAGLARILYDAIEEELNAD